jgi:two-component system, OmpR family, sensor histidine kinase RstB
MAEAPLRLRVWVEADHPVLEIAADGLRLSPEDRARLFEPRIDVDCRHGRSMRLDLGLALAHHLLSRNGARVWVESDGETGVRFRVALPGGEEMERMGADLGSARS